uniref:Uncharacterized protein LOC105632949 isoform X2 n=1 Tax=Rhizophora mucronata TaxID=61149 RepID=A0A2P2L4W1_RHIMU
MSEANQGNNPDALAILPAKRRRGRPRKYPRPDLDQGWNSHIPRDQNPSRVEHVRAPAPAGSVNGNQPRQFDPITDANEFMVGQVVNGVIEAAFDAGYLLSVRVGNSETILRGIVFRPGHYVPVSADNDVAPGIQMIRRNEIPLPRDTFTRVHGHNSRSRDRNGTVNTARAGNSVSSRGKQVPEMAPQTASSGVSKGNVVPVVLQPVNLSNGLAVSGEQTSVANQVAHLPASKGKQVLNAAHSVNNATPANQEQAVANQVLHIQSQNSHQLMPSGMQGMPFGKLLTEVIKKTQAPSHSTETSTSSSVGKLSAKDSDHTVEDDVDGTDEPLSVEPLQTLQPSFHNHPPIISRPVENYRTGKMTELLQESMMENQASQVEKPTFQTKLDDKESHS